MRILLDPGADLTAGGGAPAAAAVTPPPAAPAAPVPFTQPPAAAAQVYVPAEQWQAIQAQLAAADQFKADQQQRLEQKERDRLDALAETDKAKEALKLTRESYDIKVNEYAEKFTRVEREILNGALETAIAEATSGVAFVGTDPAKTAAFVRKVLREEVEAIRGPSGEPVVRHKATNRPALDYLRERLTSPDSEFAPLLAATHRGGAGTGGAHPAAATPQNTDPRAQFAADFKARRDAALDARF